MAASTNVNNFNIEVIMDHKQHEIPSSENTLDQIHMADQRKDQKLKVEIIWQQLQNNTFYKLTIV